MSTAAFDHGLLDAPPTTDRPFGISMLASAVVHIVLIALLASAKPVISLLPAWQAMSASLEVDLQQPAIAVPEPPPEPVAMISVPEEAPIKTPEPPKEFPMKVPVPTSAPPGAAPAQPMSIRTGPPNPTGSVIGRLLSDPADVSAATSARLAQRFPIAAARAPKLNGAVITSYPIDAARAHQSARIAAVLTVDASGKVVDGDTVLSPDDPTFRAAVLSALANAQFTPAELNGTPMAYWAVLEFVFDIDPAPGERAAATR